MFQRVSLMMIRISFSDGLVPTRQQTTAWTKAVNIHDAVSFCTGPAINVSIYQVLLSAIIWDPVLITSKINMKY